MCFCILRFGMVQNGLAYSIDHWVVAGCWCRPASFRFASSFTRNLQTTKRYSSLVSYKKCVVCELRKRGISVFFGVSYSLVNVYDS